jgi:PAS domain S-box-containing protein
MVIRRSDDFKTVVRWPMLASEVNRALPPGNPVREAMVAGKPRGTLAFPASSDGVVRTYSYRSVAGYPFFILAALAHNDVLASWRKQSLAIGTVAALLLLLLTGLLRYLWRIAEREARLSAGLREGEERLRLATAAGGIGLYDLNVQTGKAIVNAEYASILGYDPANFEESNQAWIARLHPDDTTHTFARYHDYIVGLSPTYEAEFRQRTTEGQYKWIQSQGSLVERDAEGRPLRMLGTHVDITPRKQTENALRALNLRLDFLLSSSPITLYTCEAAPPYTTTFIGRNVTTMLGYEPDEFLNTPGFWDDHLHPDDKERVAAGWPTLFAQGHLLREYRFRHHDGSWRLVEESVRLVKNEMGDAAELIGYLLDVTERRNTQQNLLVKQAAMDSALNAIAMTGMDRVTTYVNRAFLDMWKLERTEQAIGRLPREFIPNAPMLVEMILRHGRWQGEMLGQCADGSSIDLQVSAHLVKDENDQPVCMMASFVDISVRKKAEEALHNLNVELESRVQERTAKLEAANAELETFTYTVSHDLRAPLRAIDGFSNLLLQDYHESLDETGKKFLHNVRKSAQQMGTLIDDLLAYAKFERRDISVNPLSPLLVVEQLLAEYEDDIKSNSITVTVGIDCETVRTDRDALAMALRNLIGNALKFSRGAVRPEVEIGSSETASACQLWVRDNGIGFDMKYHNHIFTIFKRLERGEKYPGTGVGLAIVKKAMERVGGRAWAESEPGKGATFYLEIPK